MAHAYRVPFTPHIAPSVAKSASIALATLAAGGILLAAIMTFVAFRTQSVENERSIAAARTAIVEGMSRAEVYAWLRTHGLTATNSAYAVWRKNRVGVWYPVDDGAWPQPGERRNPAAPPPPNADHPDAVVKLTAAPSGTCGTATIQMLTFDRDDLVKHVAYSEPYWACQ